VRAIGHRAKEAEGFVLAGQRDVVAHGVGLSGELHRFGAMTIALKHRLA
jgi:hypothetical protein